MKSLALILCWSLLLYSCREVSFREPQPVGISPLREVPRALQGHYVGLDNRGNDTDTLVIEPWGYRLKDQKDNDWLGRGVISDSLVVKFYQNYYFVNFRAGNQWVLRLIRQKASGAIELLSIRIDDDATRKELLRKLGKRVKIREVKQDDNTFYQITPTKEQLIRLIQDGFFTGSELSKVR